MESTNGMGMELFDGINGMEPEPLAAALTSSFHFISKIQLIAYAPLKI